MSRVYIEKLKSIGAEFIAAKYTLEYAAFSWQKHALYNEPGLQLIGPQDIRNAAKNLEVTFIIRLFAAFEGMLKEHMAQHHSAIILPEDVRVVWLIDRVALLQAPPIGAPLRQRVHEVRKYRNTLVHASVVTGTPLLFTEVRSRLNTYLAKLSEPFV